MEIRVSLAETKLNKSCDKKPLIRGRAWSGPSKADLLSCILVLPSPNHNFPISKICRYNLYYSGSGDTSIMGYAYYGGVCKANRVSIVEYLGYSTIVAHELAHK